MQDYGTAKLLGLYVLLPRPLVAEITHMSNHAS